MLEFRDVTKRYSGGSEALRGVSFSIDRGEMVFLTGHSGAGKSTLMRLVAVMERPSRGTIRLDGQMLNQARAREIPFIRRKLGLIFQDYRLLQDRTVSENVALPMMIAGFAPDIIERRVRASLDKVGLLGRERRMPQGLSGGEQQRVGIARAIAHNPLVILADEPTGNLDPDLAAEIMDLFADFNQSGTTVLIATHDPLLVARHPVRQLVLSKGHMTEVRA
ncbi:MAG: cell division ATP-binding protein FtsE [Pseudomonadota bacterium]|jgi:cell division transport system ATP-binding protein